VCLPLDGMYEIFDRIPSSKRMVVLRHADHMHFMDNVEQLHEAVRTSPPWIPALDYLQQEMRPIAELCTGEQSYSFVRGHKCALAEGEGFALDMPSPLNDLAHFRSARTDGSAEKPRSRYISGTRLSGPDLTLMGIISRPSSDDGERAERQIPG